MVVYLGDIDTPLLRPEDQRYRAHRADGLAGTVTDAIRGLQQFGLTVENSEHIVPQLLRARKNA
jgi:hypothetical protein